MADDLSRLANIQWIEEDVLRRDVAAQVQVASDIAAVADQDKLRDAWEAFQHAESRVKELAMRCGAAEHAGALDGINSSSDNGLLSSAAVQSLSGLRFQLKTARGDLEKKEAALRRTQLEVEQRQRERLRLAKRRSLEESVGASTSSNIGPITNDAPAFSPPPPTVPFAPEFNRAHASAGGAVLARPLLALRGIPSLPGVTEGMDLNTYRGGDVLPAVGRITVTREDIRAKKMRYRDDTDLAAYHARQEKRYRCEVAKTLLRLHQREGGAGAIAGQPSSSSFSSSLNDESDGKLQNAGVRSSTGEFRAAEVKKESGKTLKRDEIEVIDVDALMEAEHDASAEILQTLLAEETHQHRDRQGGEGGRGRALMKQEGQDAGVEKRNGTNDRPGRGKAIETPTTPAAALEDSEALSREILALPPEPVVHILDGFVLDHATYDRLLDYQQEGVRWLLHLHTRRSGGILSDEMGLGKTIQTAAILNTLHRSHQLRGPALIVAPMTVLQQWVAELHRWAPALRVCVLHDKVSSLIPHEALLDSVRGTPAVVITTYATLRIRCALLNRTGFQYIILDEGHKIANPETSSTLAAKSFPTPHRLILTGSPIQNSLKELWCLFDFVKPGLLGTLDRFIEEFQGPIGLSKNIRATPLELSTAVECAKALQNRIVPYILRRVKRQVSISLPKKYERVIRVPLSDTQLEAYVELLASPEVQRVISQSLRRLQGQVYFALQKGGGIRLERFRIMNQLRQICNHVDLFKVRRGDGGGGGPSGRAVHCSFRSNNPVDLRGGAKLQVLADMLAEWDRFHHRALIFSQTRMMLDIIENLCEQCGYRYIRMDGTTNSHHRQELMDRFNEDDTVFLALLTTRVGGIGVNLTGADRVVIYDPDWNPVTDIQARERSWRIGQTRDVCIYRLLTSGTVEETILRRQLAKTYVADKVLKDPHIQRFFHQDESLAESFFLSAEYDPRVPPGKKHVLAPHEIGADALPLTGDANVEAQSETSWEEVRSVGDAAARPASTPAVASSPTTEKEFGKLLLVKEGAEAAGTPTNGISRADAAAGFGNRGNLRSAEAYEGEKEEADGSETALLKRLLDGKDISVAGADAAVRRLAQMRAAQSITRVTNAATRSMMDQQREFSLMHATYARSEKATNKRR